MAVNKREGQGLLSEHIKEDMTSEKFPGTRAAKGF